MARDCIFCRIVAHEIPAQIVAEDPAIVAFLDIQPLARGHTLVVPKTHVRLLQDLPPPQAQAFFAAVQALTTRIQRAIQAPSSTIAINNGPESGQEVPHLHVHIIPRFPGDHGGPIHAIMTRRPTLAPNELAKIAETIRRTP